MKIWGNGECDGGRPLDVPQRDYPFSDHNPPFFGHRRLHPAWKLVKTFSFPSLPLSPSILPLFFVLFSCFRTHPTSSVDSASGEEWSAWSVCSATCGEGWQSRTRFCVSSSYSTQCSGPLREQRPCNNSAICPGKPPPQKKKQILLPPFHLKK